jgi:hypothetical protein
MLVYHATALARVGGLRCSILKVAFASRVWLGTTDNALRKLRPDLELHGVWRDVQFTLYMHAFSTLRNPTKTPTNGDAMFMTRAGSSFSF